MHFKFTIVWSAINQKHIEPFAAPKTSELHLLLFTNYVPHKS